MLKHYLLKLLIIVLSIYSLTACMETRTNAQRVMDPVGEVPEWLQFRVEKALPEAGLNVWVPTNEFQISAAVRVPRFPGEITGDPQNKQVALDGVRNEQISAQLAVATTKDIKDLRVSISDLKSEDGSRISSDKVSTRFVQYIPVVRAHSEYVWSATIEEVAGNSVSGNRMPDVVGDPLAEEPVVDVPAYRVQPIWFTFHLPKSCQPGKYTSKIIIQTGNVGSDSLNLTINVHDFVLPNPQDFKFHLEIWLNPNAVAALHGVDDWSDEHWNLLKNYMRDLAEHSEKVINTTIMEEPWQVPWLDGSWRPQTAIGFESMVKWYRDGEQWTFDYSLFDRYVKVALEQGMGPWISAWSILSFRGEQRVTYFSKPENKMIEKKYKIGDPGWEEAWTAFLKDFQKHLKAKGWFEQTILAFDERPAHLMNAVKSLIKDAAPEFLEHIFISGSPMEVSDNPAEEPWLSIAYNFLPGKAREPEGIKSVMQKRQQNNRLTIFYTAGTPAHPNTFTFSPAVESYMIPWIAAKYDLDGYIRWAYNSWPRDVYHSPVFRYIQGDEYVVYPGANGPLSSIRWELLKEGIEDYEIIQRLRQKNEVDTLRLNHAIDLVTRNSDGRHKNVHDIADAKQILFSLLSK